MCMSQFEQFLDQFIHYMCSRCVLFIPHHTAQDKDGGKHSHNGEIFKYLGNAPPTSDTILSAYHTWQSHRPPSNIQRELANSYNSRRRTVPRTSVERATRIILDNINDTWIRHGAEQPEHTMYSLRSSFPNHQSRIQVGTQVLEDPASGWFAVDFDRTPFSVFEEHPVENQLGPVWVYTVGLIPLRRFSEYAGQLHHPHDRDHYYAQVNIPGRYWVFLYRDFDEYAQDLNQQEHSRQQMLSSDVPAIHYNEYTKLIQLYRHLMNHSETAHCRSAKKPKSAKRQAQKK